MASHVTHIIGEEHDTVTDRASVILLIALISLVSLVPAGLFYLLPVTSQATGTLFVSVTVIMLGLVGVINRQSRVRAFDGLVVAGMSAMFILAHLSIAAFEVPADLGRTVMSLCLVGLALVAAAQLAGQWVDASSSLTPAIKIVSFIFLFFALLGALRIQPSGASLALSSEKSVFPFPEPSHYAIAFAPLLTYACATSTPTRRLFWIGAGFLTAIGLQNLTLVLATLVAAALTMPIWQIVAGLAASVPALAVTNLTYFTDRLDFSLRSSTYSSLIYRQGWELAGDAIQRTNGWGIGFQQLGIVPFTSPSADLLHLYLGEDSNLLDGGFGAAKLLSEFGIFGLILLALYVFTALRFALRLRRIVIARLAPALPLDTFCYALICSSSIEVFVRGVGYFSGSFLLLASALFIWRRSGAIMPWRTGTPTSAKI